MSTDYTSSSRTSTDFSRFACNPRVHEISCYVELGGSAYEVPVLCKFNSDTTRCGKYQSVK